MSLVFAEKESVHFYFFAKTDLLSILVTQDLVKNFQLLWTRVSLHVWSCNAIFILTLISIKQKFIDSDLQISEMSELIFSSCSQCWNIFTQFIKIIDKDDKTVKTVMNIIDDVKNIKRIEKKICFKHQKKLIRTAEFQVKLLNSEVLQNWLQIYWIN